MLIMLLRLVIGLLELFALAEVLPKVCAIERHILFQFTVLVELRTDPTLTLVVSGKATVLTIFNVGAHVNGIFECLAVDGGQLRNICDCIDAVGSLLKAIVECYPNSSYLLCLL